MIQLKENSLLPSNTKLGDQFQVVKSFYGDLLYLDGVVTSIPPHRRFGVVTYGNGIRESWAIRQGWPEWPVVPVVVVKRRKFPHRSKELPPWQKHLRKLRVAQGLGQCEVAQMIGVPPDTYGNWERCTRSAPLELLKPLQAIFPTLEE